ncbi:cytochrome c-type biogenesis protein [Enterococcus sp. DIV1420a]
MPEISDFSLVSLLLIFWAGIASCLSPCVLPIFPIFMSYITGIAVKDLSEEKDVKKITILLTHATIFLLAVSLIFISLGLGASFLGEWLRSLMIGRGGALFRRVIGIYVIIMGLFLGGWLTVPLMMKEFRFHYERRKVSYFSTFFIGLGFAAGWTPCIGPILSSILLLVTSHPNQAALYILVYIIGFILPFLLLTLFIGKTKWLSQHSGIIMKISAVLMIIMGLVLVLGVESFITNYISELL